jgi:hypothetical protein
MRRSDFPTDLQDLNRHTRAQLLLIRHQYQTRCSLLDRPDPPRITDPLTAELIRRTSERLERMR